MRRSRTQCQGKPLTQTRTFSKVEQEVLGYREWKKGRTRKITNIDEDISPDLDLQETGVSRLATPDEVELFTSITTTGH